MNVLCVAAHPDDEVLGAGGTLARHAAEGDDVHVCFLSDGVASRHDEVDDDVRAQIERRRDCALEACDCLDIESTSFHDYPDNKFDSIPLLDVVRTIESEIGSVDPSVVYTHHYGDLNVDHEISCRATVTATRPLPDSGIQGVFAYETLSATEWSVPAPWNAFRPETFVNIEGHLSSKLEALRAYEDELRDRPHPRSIETVRMNAEVWGAKAGVPAAEPFETVRTVR